jgi:hypothetical protein
VTATSILKNISLLGGTVQIASITTTSTHQTDGVAAPVHHDQVTISGVTVAGQPATIDQNGVSVAGAGQGKPALDALNSALQQLLSASGAVVRIVSPSGPAQANGAPTGLYSQEFGTGCMSGEADGVQVYLPIDARSLPYPAGSVYFANLTLGSSCADATAGAERISDLSISDSGSGGSGSGFAGGATSGGSGGGSTSFSNPSGGSSPSSGFTAGGSTGSSPSTSGSTHRQSVGAVPALFGIPLRNRLAFLYLSFTLAFAGLALGFAQFAPARLPRHR